MYALISRVAKKYQPRVQKKSRSLLKPQCAFPFLGLRNHCATKWAKKRPDDNFDFLCQLSTNCSNSKTHWGNLRSRITGSVLLVDRAGPKKAGGRGRRDVADGRRKQRSCSDIAPFQQVLHISLSENVDASMSRYGG